MKASKKTITPTLTVALVVTWSVSVIYTTITLYAWGYNVDELGLAGEMRPHEIASVIIMILLFVLALLSSRLWRNNKELVQSHAHLVRICKIIGCFFVLPFTCIVLFFIGHVLFILL